MDYTLIRSSRRSLAIQIDKSGTLIVRAPMRLSVTKIEAFIDAKQSWIEKHQKKRITKDGNTLQKNYSNVEIRTMKSDLLLYLEERIPELWLGNHLPQYTSIRVTKSEKRWGSCSGNNGLCFSYRLAEWLDSLRAPQLEMTDTITPSNFIDAIIIHELAHLREKNHQKPFWNLVYQMMPEYEEIMSRGRQ